MIRLAAALALAVLLPALPANARLLDDMNEHDGFFLRFHLGGGSMNAKWRDLPANSLIDDLSIDGPSGTFAFSLGGAVAPNLILFGELTSDAASNPRTTINGDRGRSDSSLSVVGFGPGVSYYFMPVNLYLSGSVLFTRATVSAPNRADGQSDQGLGFKFAVGKEWWVSRDWGIGVAGFGMFASIPDGEATINWSNYGLAFTATYN